MTAIIISGQKRQVIQHPSWESFGYLGPVTVDGRGNIYTAPVPVINVLRNPALRQNKILQVSGKSGELSEYLDLGGSLTYNPENPYGILTLFVECDLNILYAGTVSGSSRELIKGEVVAIDLGKNEVIGRVTGLDPLGVTVGKINGKWVLISGDSRSSNIYMRALSTAGNFTDDSWQPIISLSSRGPRGNDKARRLRFQKTGELIVHGVEFNFNLTAPTEKEETIYQFKRGEDNSWDEITDSLN